MCIEKVVVRKSGEERQDTASSDVRTSFDHSDKHGGTWRETCRGETDIRIWGLPLSAVQEHDHIRKQAAQKLIHQFENHPNKEAPQEDLQQKRAFNPFSEKSKEMIHGIGNIEYFEICWINPNIQSTNCLTCWPKGIVCCTCGTCLRPSDKVRKLNSDRYDVQSIPTILISHGRRNGNTRIQRMYHEAHGSSRKATKKRYTGKILEMSYSPIITIEHRVDWRALCKTGRDRGRGPFLNRYDGRTSTTRTHLGLRAQQFKAKRTHKSKSRLWGGKRI